MEQVLEVVRQETYGESSRSRAVYEALLELLAKAVEAIEKAREKEALEQALESLMRVN